MLKARLESQVLLTHGTVLFILETKGGTRKSSPATTHSRPHSFWPEPSKIPAHATPQRADDAGPVSKGHTVTLAVCFFSESKKRCRISSRLSRPRQGREVSSRSLKLQLFIY